MPTSSASGETEAPPPERRRGRRRKTGGEVVTHLKLLDSAEEQFAQRGFYGVTTREVAKAAGCDDALIYYHFGSKRGLFEAVFERRAHIANEVRRVALRAYEEANAGAVTIRGLVAAFINPVIDLSMSRDRGWKSYFALVAQLDNTPGGGDIIHRYFDPAVYELIAAIKRAFPDTAERELYWAYNFFAGSMMLALSESGRVDRLSYGLCRAADLESARERLIDFCTGGVSQLMAAAASREPAADADDR